MFLVDEDDKETYSLILKLEARGYFISKFVNPDVSSNDFKESLNGLLPDDYLVCIGGGVEKGVKILQNKLRSISAAFFVVDRKVEVDGSLKAKKVFVYGNEFAEDFGLALDVDSFIDDEKDVLLEELLIDIISLEHQD